MNFISRLFNLIKKGLLGNNKGFDMGLPKLEAVVDGVQKGLYTLLAGGTGSGKTTLALYSYIYRPLMENLENNKFRVVYYSLEMSGEILLAKLLSLHIYETYNIELGYRDIMSKQEVLSDDMFQLVESCQPWLEQIQEKIVIYDKNLTSDMLYANLMEYANLHGTFDETKNNSTYTQNDPDCTHLIVIDHLGLLRKAHGRTKKEEIDQASNYLISFRNRCAFSILALIQLNRGSSSMDRRNNNMQEIQLDDLKDSGGPSEDAEVVIAIFNPFREKMQSHADYNIAILRDKFRAIQVLKNRFGEADKSIAVNFFGSIGLWRELPKAEVLGRLQQPEYAPYLWLIPPVVEKQDPAKTGMTGFTYRF